MIDVRNDLFIDGAFRPALTVERISLINPVSEEVIGMVPAADAADVAAAVQAARRAFPEWSRRPPEERALVLDAIADAYEARGEEFRALITLQNGSPSWWTELTNAAPIYRLGAAAARNFPLEVPFELLGRKALVHRQAIGVVGAIAPWNAPQVLMAGKIAMALAAGDTVVAKPSPETSLDAYLLAEVFQEAGVPNGVVNIVTGGAVTGEALVRNEDVDKVAFTGSTSAGRAIAEICGSLLRPLSAELGGKSAAVLLDDADLEHFTSVLNRECIPYSGQVCFSATRVLVPRTRFADTVDAITTTLRATPYGDPDDPGTIIGPLVSERQRDRVRGYIRGALTDGATAVLGGDRDSDFARGYYVDPTVFVDVEPEMPVFREEVFGPVMSVLPYDDEAEAVSLHDATPYGLSGVVFSADIERATDFARRLATGRVLVNAVSPPPHRYDGFGVSGFGGGGGGLYRIADYVNTKVISQPG